MHITINKYGAMNGDMHENKSRGFTLVELSIVILITGLLFIPLVRQYSLYETDRKTKDTKIAVSFSGGMMDQYNTELDAYPCPADASLLPTDPNFGVEQCVALSALALDTCNASGGLCRVSGARPINATVRSVYIGSVPINTYRSEFPGAHFSNEEVLDSWGQRVMYAVSADLTSTATYKYYNGVIAAEDEWNNPTAGVNNDAHFTVYSVGRDKRGGFNDAGVQASPCATAGVSNDYENCDLDSTFVQAKGLYMAVGTDYYDDYVLFVRSLDSGIWTYDENNTDIRTNIDGNVGVGTDTPTFKLDIQDAGVASLRADNAVVVDRICNLTGTVCFDVKDMTENAVNCPVLGEVMVGMKGDLVLGLTGDCAEPVYAAPIPFSCAAGQWLNGFDSDGNVICAP